MHASIFLSYPTGARKSTMGSADEGRRPTKGD
jgi:hypothetical protein